MMILAPASPSASAQASPMPCPPPVTTATRPPSLNFSRYIFLFILFANRLATDWDRRSGWASRRGLSCFLVCFFVVAKNPVETAEASRQWSAPNGLALRVEAVQAGWIRRQPDAVTGFQIQFADIAASEQSKLAGIDIEKSIAAKMLGDRHGPGPAFSLLADLQVFG